jgi:hypothetical protein
MQELLLQREGDGAGTMVLDHGDHYYTLENPALQIPAGSYLVKLTLSGRAQKGTLWTCWPDAMLPELQAVPGRTAIRLHAANEREQLEGCIAAGTDRTADKKTLVHSRLALEALAASLRFPCRVTILDPKESK